MNKVKGAKNLGKYYRNSLNQGPLITDGRKSNEMGFSKISFGRMTLAFQK